MRWRCFSKPSPWGSASSPETIYPENYGALGFEAALFEAWREIEKNRHDDQLSHGEWLRRHLGIYVEMLLGVDAEHTRFRLVAFDGDDGLIRYFKTFNNWSGPVIFHIQQVGKIVEIVKVSSKYL